MTRQLITFQIGQQVLGVDIMAIREIRAWSPATPLPNVPSHVRGVVNLRGLVVPVIDLSQLIGWGQAEPSARHVIIVVRIGHQLQGLIVDAVNDIVTIDAGTMQPPPEINGFPNSRIIDGIATIAERMVMVLNLVAIVGDGTSYSEAA